NSTPSFIWWRRRTVSDSQLHHIFRARNWLTLRAHVPVSLNVISQWLPRSVIELRSYTRQKFLHDAIAGITVGLVALPLAMAFAIASGLTPQAGLYTAIVAGFIISALGGSATQIGGPTGAFVVVVFGIVARYGIDGL